MCAQVSKIENIECDEVAPEVASELLRQGELRLDAVFNAALGMDARASVVGAAFAAAAAALLAGAFAVLDTHPVWRTIAFLEAFFLFVSAALSLFVCRPQKSRFPGIDPDDWADIDFLKKPIKDLLLSRAMIISNHLKENERKQSRNGISFALSLYLAASSPLLAIFIFFVLRIA